MQKQSFPVRDSSQQALGRDTKVLISVIGAVCNAVMIFACPFLSVPSLKYSGIKSTYTLWKVQEGLTAFSQSKTEKGITLKLFSSLVLSELSHIIHGLWLFAILTIGLLLLYSVLAMVYRKKERAVQIGRITFLISMLLPVVCFILCLAGNLYINTRLGLRNDFQNISIQSVFQLTAYPYAEFLLSLLLFISIKILLDRKLEENIKQTVQNRQYMGKNVCRTEKSRKRKIKNMLLLMAGIPLVIFIGVYFLNNRNYYFIALAMISLAMLPFFTVFEYRRPQVRELILIAVLSSIAVAGRAAFFMIPQFKPVAAIVIITGISLGAEAGFLTGAVSAFVSDFFFGQGPWTPWQMFAFGMIGLLSGLIFHGKRQGISENRWFLYMFGGLSTFLIYGMIMDSASVFMIASDYSLKAFAAMYISGVPFNLIHSISTVVFLYFLNKPMRKKLKRIIKKYGISDW